MHLDGTLVPAKLRPGKQRQAQIDGGAVEGVAGGLQWHAKTLVGMQLLGLGDEYLGEIGPHAPVAAFVGLGQRGTGDGQADARMVKVPGHSAQAGLDIAQRFAEGELGEGHHQELIPAAEAPDAAIAVVALNTFAEFVPRKKRHELGKYQLTRVHESIQSALRPPQDGRKEVGS